jgi:hypothetical protein
LEPGQFRAVALDEAREFFVEFASVGGADVLLESGLVAVDLEDEVLVGPGWRRR